MFAMIAAPANTCGNVYRSPASLGLLRFEPGTGVLPCYLLLDPACSVTERVWVIGNATVDQDLLSLDTGLLVISGNYTGGNSHDDNQSN